MYRFDELILPMTGLFMALTVNVKPQTRKPAIAVITIFALLIAPLGPYRDTRGRVR